MSNPVNMRVGPSIGEPRRSSDRRYVLLTAAYNEESYIAQTIESVISQTVLPAKWGIVIDGSTDRTDEIVQSYRERYPFIQLVRVERAQSRGVGSKVSALSRG